MSLLWLALAAIALWLLVRLGRLTERRRRGHWRISATFLGAALLGGAAFATVKGAWLTAAAMAAGGLWLAFSSRLRAPSGRTDARFDAAAGQARSDLHLSDAEARSILGVGQAASEAEIQAAWKRLMARVHPDQGGAEGLAARVNAARDRLIRR